MLIFTFLFTIYRSASVEQHAIRTSFPMLFPFGEGLCPTTASKHDTAGEKAAPAS